MARIKDFRLKSCKKHYTLDQDKVVEPTETVKKALARLRKRFDLSNVRIERRKDAVDGAYSFTSASDQMNASGKGLTPDQAQASAIMEFNERYSWLHFDYERAEGYTVKSFDQIREEGIRTVNESWFLNNLTELDDPSRKDYTEEIKHIPLKWVKGVSLLDYKEFYYPLNWYNYFFTSNGLATGNAMEEAILQALCEVIERENLDRMFREGKEGNDLDQGSIRNPLILRVLENAKKEGIEFILKDISLDFKIPTFIAHGIRRADEGKLTHRGCGHGTHPDPEKALIRALSEYFEGYSQLKNIQEQVKMEWRKIIPRLPQMHFGFLVRYNTEMLSRRKMIVKISDIPNLSRDDIKEEIELLVKRLKKHKYDNVVLIDKTHSEMQIPVPRIFVPGFRNIMAAELDDPRFIMSMAHYEAGNIEAATKYFRESMKKTSFFTPELIRYADPRKVFKSDYKETLMSFGGLKKDSVQMLKRFVKIGKGIKF